MGLPDFSASQLTTIKNTVAKDTNTTEFDLFMNAARSYGLDPFRKQISAIVFNKDKPDKRQMAIIVGRDGLRSIAARCGDYRPASGPASVVYSDEAKDSTNPKGIVSVGITLFKQDNKGSGIPSMGRRTGMSSRRSKMNGPMMKPLDATSQLARKPSMATGQRCR